MILHSANKSILIENVGDKVVIAFHRSDGDIEYNLYKFEDGGVFPKQGNIDKKINKSIIDTLVSLCHLHLEECEISYLKEYTKTISKIKE